MIKCRRLISLDKSKANGCSKKSSLFIIEELNKSIFTANIILTFLKSSFHINITYKELYLDNNSLSIYSDWRQTISHVYLYRKPLILFLFLFIRVYTSWPWKWRHYLPNILCVTIKLKFWLIISLFSNKLNQNYNNNNNNINALL